MTAAAPYPKFDGTQACADIRDVDVFFSGNPADMDEALAACTRCTFKDACAAYALTHEVRGIWGGLTGPTRRAVQRKYGIKPHRLELADTHTVIAEVERLTENGLSGDEIAERTGLASRSVHRIRGSRSA